MSPAQRANRGAPSGIVRVEPVRLERMEALVEGDQVFTERFDITVVHGWAGFPEALGPALEAARRHDRDPWGSHLLVDMVVRAGVSTVIAHTLAETTASTTVLARCGFRRTATVHDEELDDRVWRWELDVRGL